MEQPPDLPPAADQTIRIRIVPAPIWVRFLAGTADTIVAGLLAFAIIMVILIPRFYPETESLIYEYADQSSGNFLTDTELARTMMENNSLRSMLFASQMVLYSVFFLYFLLNEWLLRGGSLGKMIFRISTVRRNPDQPLSLGIMFLRAWLKTVFLLLFSPILWLTFVWAVVHKERRTVHDLLTGTWVID